MTSELLLMALNVIKEYCTDRFDKEEQPCNKDCSLYYICHDYFFPPPKWWEMELIEK